MFNISNAAVAGVVCVAAVVWMTGCTGAKFRGEKTARVDLPAAPAGTIGRAAPVNGDSFDEPVRITVREAPSVSAFVDLESALEAPAPRSGEVEVRTRVLPPASQGDASAASNTASVALGRRPVVRITSQRGWVAVKPGSAGSVSVVGHVRATTPERYEAADVVALRELDGSVTVRMDWPGAVNVGEEAGLEVTVPPEADVDVRTPSGRLSVANLRGELFLRTGNGAIELTNHRGPVRAETGGGRVDLVDVNGPVTVRSGGGDVTVVMTPASEAMPRNAAVGSWQIAGADAKPQPPEAAEAAGLVDLQTARGLIRLTLPRDFGEHLELQTGSGVVDVRDLPAARIIATRDDYMHLAIGEGQGKSRAVTGRGNVVVRVGRE